MITGSPRPSAPPTRRRFRPALLALPVAAALLLGACTEDQPVHRASDGASALATGVLSAGTEEQLQAALEEAVETYDVPGAVMGVFLPGSEWESAVGVSDLDSGQAMTGDLVWPLRSVTKSFTVTILLQLVDEGLVSLEDTLDQWFPEVPNSEQITLGQLADMTAGVAEYTNDAFIEEFSVDQDRVYTPDELIGFALTEPPTSDPGEEHVYINTSTVILGEVIEAVTGSTFTEELQTRILEPLDLADTVYPSDPHGWTGDHATGYQPVDGEMAPQDGNFTVFGAAGAMISTMDDLRHWGTALATGSLLEEDTHAARLEGSPLDAGPEYDQYAYGIGELEGWWGHTGEGFGVTLLVMHDTEADATVVIFMNLSNGAAHAPTKLFREVAGILAAG
jgi:D-alanyl-D-alanine carboxypeptidase